MLKIVVCIGSACHLKGSRQVVEELQGLIAKHDIKAQIDLGGTFCLGQCQNKGVNIKVDEKSYDIAPDRVVAFFQDVIMKQDVLMTDN